jgi:uncharacterized protein (TIGR03086 family)
VTFDVLNTSLDALRSAADGVAAEQLGQPTPCSEWTVGQVLMHAAGDQHAWAATVGSADMPTYNPFDPPQEAEGGTAEAVRAAVEAAARTWADVDPTLESLPTPLPPVPTLAPELAAAAAALDAAIHAWDVAVATGQPSPLTASLAGQLRPAAEATADSLRGFAYAPPLPEVAGDDEASALLRYLGRDPEWS